MENTRATKFVALPAVVTPGPVRVAVPGAPAKGPAPTVRPFLPAIAVSLDSKFAAAARQLSAADLPQSFARQLSGHKRPYSTNDEDTE